MGCGDEKLSKYLTQNFTAHCHAMICQQVTLLGDAEWPKVADAVIEAIRKAHLPDDMKNYGSEPEAIVPFPGEAAGHKHGHMLRRKFMWQDRHSATQRSPTV